MFKDNAQFLNFFFWFLFLFYSEIIPWSLLIRNKQQKTAEWQSFNTKPGQLFVPQNQGIYIAE